MKIFKKILTHVFILVLITVPILSLAQINPRDPTYGLVPCGNDTTQGMCNFAGLMQLINNIVGFILFYIAVPVAAIMFAYAGFLMVTAGGEAAHARTKAKNIFTDAVIGLALAAGAWLIISTILHILGFTATATWGF